MCYVPIFNHTFGVNALTSESYQIQLPKTSSSISHLSLIFHQLAYAKVIPPALNGQTCAEMLSRSAANSGESDRRRRLPRAAHRTDKTGQAGQSASLRRHSKQQDRSGLIGRLTPDSTADPLSPTLQYGSSYSNQAHIRGPIHIPPLSESGRPPQIDRRVSHCRHLPGREEERRWYGWREAAPGAAPSVTGAAAECAETRPPLPPRARQRHPQTRISADTHRWPGNSRPEQAFLQTLSRALLHSVIFSWPDVSKTDSSRLTNHVIGYLVDPICQVCSAVVNSQ